MRHDGAPAPRWPYVLFRGSTTTAAVLAVAQPVLAGGFLSGYYDALTAHLIAGIGMVVVAVVQVGVAVFLRRAGGPDIVRMSLYLPLMLAAQAALGMFHLLVLHIPLGVLMVTGATRLAASAWRTPLPGRAGAGGAPAGGTRSGSAAAEDAAAEHAAAGHAAAGHAAATAGTARPAPAGPAGVLS